MWTSKTNIHWPMDMYYMDNVDMDAVIATNMHISWKMHQSNARASWLAFRDECECVANHTPPTIVEECVRVRGKKLLTLS